MWQAEQQARNCRADFPEAALEHYDTASPSVRTRFLHHREAEASLAITEDASRLAHAALDRALARLDAISDPHLGLRPGPLGEPGDPYGTQDDGSIRWAQHAADRARKQRINSPGSRGFS